MTITPSCPFELVESASYCSLMTASNATCQILLTFSLSNYHSSFPSFSLVCKELTMSCLQVEHAWGVVSSHFRGHGGHSFG